MARNPFAVPVIQNKMKLKFLILFLLGGITSAFSQKNTTIIGDYSYSLTPSNKIGLKYKDQTLIDTIYFAFFGLDTANKRIWANRSTVDTSSFSHKNNEEQNDQTIQLGNHWELLNLKGQKITDANFDLPSKFINQKAIVTKDNKYCIIDVDGNYLTGFDFDKIEHDEQNLLYLKRQNTWGIMNQQLQWIVSPFYDDITTFIGNFCLAIKNDTLYAVNRNGIKKSLNDVLNSESIFNYIDSNFLKEKFEVNDMESFIIGSNQINYLKSTEIKREIVNESMLYFVKNIFRNHSILYKIEGIDFPENILKSESVIENNWLENGTLMSLFEYVLQITNDSIVTTAQFIVNFNTENEVTHFNSDKLVCNNYLVKNHQLNKFSLDQVCHPNYNLTLQLIFLKECENNQGVETYNLSPMEMFKGISNNYVFMKDGLTFYYFKNIKTMDTEFVEIQLSPQELMMILRKGTPIYNYYLEILKNK